MYTYGQDTPSTMSPNNTVLSPVDGRWYGQVGGMVLAFPHQLFGGASMIQFDREVTVEKIGIRLSAPYSYAVPAPIRLGIYEDDGTGKPGALLADAGTLTLTSGVSTAGINSLTFGTPVVLQPNTRYWLACKANVAATAAAIGTQALVVYQAGSLPPYVNYGSSDAAGSALSPGIAFTYQADGSTALDSTFTLDVNNPAISFTPLVSIEVSL